MPQANALNLLAVSLLLSLSSPTIASPTVPTVSAPLAPSPVGGPLPIRTMEQSDPGVRSDAASHTGTGQIAQQAPDDRRIQGIQPVAPPSPGNRPIAPVGRPLESSPNADDRSAAGMPTPLLERPGMGGATAPNQGEMTVPSGYPSTMERPGTSPGSR